MFFASPLQRSNLCASHRQRRWLTSLSYALVGLDSSRSACPDLRNRRFDRFLSRLLCRQRGHPGPLGPAGGKLPLFAQWLLFASLSIGTLVLFRARLREKIKTREQEVDKLEDEIAVATERLVAGATGQAGLRGSTWSARNIGEVDLEAGDRCRVERVDGLVLLIRKDL